MEQYFEKMKIIGGLYNFKCWKLDNVILFYFNVGNFDKCGKQTGLTIVTFNTKLTQPFYNIQ